MRADAGDPASVEVSVTLDGRPAEAVVMQGGVGRRHRTGADGRVRLVPVAGVGEAVVIASHPRARQAAVPMPDPGGSAAIALSSYGPDNPDYEFRPPGVAGEPGTSAECVHCHPTLVADHEPSPHAGAASNPMVLDLYAGTARLEQAGCEQAGGRWLPGLQPGTGEPVLKCYLGLSALAQVNDCGGEVGCDAVATEFAGCADCHAPGIGGRLAGNDLLAARGLAFEGGVHCDVCHRVESVEVDGAPGVAGRLRLHRPSEPPAYGFANHPLVFGPFHDVPSPVMGAVQRDLFLEAELCAGCHEHAVRPTSIDRERWPDGVLPVDTTYSEFRAGPYAGGSCQQCHMPPADGLGNSADLASLGIEPGEVPGWPRAPGQVRHHSWPGPRNRQGRVGVSLSASARIEGPQLVVEVVVGNVGAGHAIPTGEALRTLLLGVEGRCAEAELQPAGGDVIPGFVGAGDRHEGRPDPLAAGRPGYAFARVLVDAAGVRAPHFAAVDEAVDNRLEPQARKRTEHRFELAGCAAPRAVATLTHRPWPEALRLERGWPRRDTVVATALAEP